VAENRSARHWANCSDPQRVAAADHQGFAGDEAGFGRAEEQHRADQVLHPALALYQLMAVDEGVEQRRRQVSHRAG